jgi:hypothetical protein
MPLVWLISDVLGGVWASGGNILESNNNLIYILETILRYVI